MAPPRQPIGDRFVAKIEPEPMSGCWLFAGALVDGYGVLSTPRGEFPRQVRAHVFAWRLSHGPIPEGLCVLHRCDNRACVNPDHLFLGTRADNMHDMWRKKRGRWRVPPKLTPRTVGEIRARYAAGGVTQQSLANEFGVSQMTISNVIARRTWKETPPWLT